MRGSRGRIHVAEARLWVEAESISRRARDGSVGGVGSSGPITCRRSWKRDRAGKMGDSRMGAFRSRRDPEPKDATLPASMTSISHRKLELREKILNLMGLRSNAMIRWLTLDRGSGVLGGSLALTERVGWGSSVVFHRVSRVSHGRLFARGAESRPDV